MPTPQRPDPLTEVQRLGQEMNLLTREELISLLRPLVNAGDDACLNRTPMIPLHKHTVASALHYLESTGDAQAERKAIVAWLRDPRNIAGILSEWEDRRHDGTLSEMARENRGVAWIAASEIATAIEAGQHMGADSDG